MEFKKINDESLNNTFNKENIDCLASNESTQDAPKLKLDGQDFIKSIQESINDQNLNDFEEKILKFVYENMDRNSSIRNAKIGSLFNENYKQLDLIK